MSEGLRHDVVDHIRVTHPEAFTPHGWRTLTPPRGRRRLAALAAWQGRSLRRAAERFQVSPTAPPAVGRPLAGAASR